MHGVNKKGPLHNFSRLSCNVGGKCGGKNKGHSMKYMPNLFCTLSSLFFCLLLPKMGYGSDEVLCFSSALDLGLQVWDDTRKLIECENSADEQLLKDIILGRLTRLGYEIKMMAQQLDAQEDIVMVSDLELVRTIISHIEKEFYHQEQSDASSAIVAPLARSICADIKELI